jgi:hypothetical protein
MRFLKNSLFRLMSYYPPFLGAGIRVRLIRTNPLAFETQMHLHWWNRNYVGTHFGGSLYTMTDPFFMLILQEGLGKEFVVWDKAAHIRYRRPGRGLVRARFEIPVSEIEAIRAQALAQRKLEVRFVAEVLNTQDEVIATVEKILSVRRRMDPPKGQLLPRPNGQSERPAENQG